MRKILCLLITAALFVGLVFAKSITENDADYKSVVEAFNEFNNAEDTTYTNVFDDVNVCWSKSRSTVAFYSDNFQIYIL